MSELLILAPLRIEAQAARHGAPAARVLRSGMGARRARRAAARARDVPAGAVAVLGFCGALAPGMAPGDLVVADEVRLPEGASIPSPAGELLAGPLRRAGLRVHRGAVLTVPRPVRGDERARLHAQGAIVADLESAWLAEAAGARPLAVLRAVVDTRERELLSLATVPAALHAWRALSRASAVAAEWAAAAAPRRIVLGAPRASCAGVERAVAMTERALARHGPPLYVRHHIVHNAHVVADLEDRGVVFVDDLDEVPVGETVLFSAHGVAPDVRAVAEHRSLHVIDATCPLVSKVHAEARGFAARGYTVVLIGHRGHDEVVGTLGEAPRRIRLVESLADAESLEVEDPERVAYLTQTTLAVDETREIVDVLRRRFPRLAGPRKEDICFASQNRQDAVKALARECDAILVVGSASSSNSRRLVEVAERAGCRGLLIDDASTLDPAWLTDARTIGVTAGASAPERLVQGVVRALRTLGPVEVSERVVTRETATFKLPLEVR
jgi:4-hydroxy-3-methylbut-2-enyl diphosphate reductase